MTWKDYALIAALQLIFIFGGIFVVDRWVMSRYPAMTTYVDQVGAALLQRVQPWAQDLDRRVKALEEQTRAREKEKK